MSVFPPHSPRRYFRPLVTLAALLPIMTLLLAINGYPMGDKELSPDPEVLRQIKIVLP